MPDERYASALWASVANTFRYPAAGMQQLLDTVRETDATNVVVAGGPKYAGDLDGWVQYELVDRLGQPAVSIHVYLGHPSPTELLALLRLAPVDAGAGVVGEFGGLECEDSLYPPFLDFADQHGISYLGWAWFPGRYTGGPSLITNYSGTPTAYGIGYQRHLISLGLGS
jgi:endoglucanase